MPVFYSRIYMCVCPSTVISNHDCLCVTGAASKRFGIDGDREALPLALYIVYNKVLFSTFSKTQLQNYLRDIIFQPFHHSILGFCKWEESKDRNRHGLHLNKLEESLQETSAARYMAYRKL